MDAGVFLCGVCMCILCDKLRTWIGEGNGTPLQYSCLENPMDRGAWRVTVHRVAKSRTRLSDFTFTFHFPALEKEMATHSSVLAWRIPGDGGAWWAAVYGIAQSRTWLKRLSSSSNSRTLMYMLSWNKRFIILTIYGVMNTSPCHYIFFYNIIFIISPTYCKGNKAHCYLVHQFRNIKKQNHGFVFMFWDFFPFLISFKRAIFTCGSFFFF